MASQITAINKRYWREMKFARSIVVCHDIRNELICQARAHRRDALRALGIRAPRRGW